MTKEQRAIMRARVALIRSLDKVMRDGPSRISHLARRVWATVLENKDHMLAFSSDEPKTQVSYATKPDYKWDDKRRTRLTLGKYYRRQIEPAYLAKGQDSCSDETLQTLTAWVFATQAKPSDFEIVKGEDITKAYKNAVGAHSCMTEDCANLVELYEVNPEKVGLAIFRGIEKNARALLWTTDDGTRVLDRIYPNDGPHVQAYYTWAESQGFVTRDGNGYVDFGDPGLSDRTHHRITLRRPPSGEYPYLDTFFYGEFVMRGGRKFVVLSNDEEFGDKMFHDTCGGFREKCAECNCWAELHDDEGTGYCEECYHHVYARCDCCDHETLRDNVAEFDGGCWCDDCISKHTFECERCGVRYRNSNQARCDGDDRELCCSCAQHDLHQCHRCHTFYKEESKLHECIDGLMRCENCAKCCPDCGKWMGESNISRTGVCFDCRARAMEAERERLTKENADETLAEKAA